MEKKNEKGKVQLKGQLKLYIQWPAIMSLLLIAMDLWVYKLDHRAGILMAVFVVVYIIMVGGLYFYSKNIIMKTGRVCCTVWHCSEYIAERTVDSLCDPVG